MRLSDIHAAIEAGRGPSLPEDEAFATLVAIEHLARIEGIPVSALNFSAPLFSVRYSYHRTDLRGAWKGRAQYLAWRNLILNAQMRFAPGDVDGDPWLSLGRAERLSRRGKSATCYDLRIALPAGTRPCDVTDDLLMHTYRRLSGTMLRFRSGVCAFRRLFEFDVVRCTGLLPPERPSLLPGLRDHHALAPMAPEIEELRSSLKRKNTINALDYVHRLATAGGLLTGQDDTPEDLRKALACLPDPEDVGIPPIKNHVLRHYINQLMTDIGGRDYRLSKSEQAWTDLRKAARAAECDTSFLWALGKPATARNLCPWELCKNHALEITRSYKNSSAQSQCRRGCEQIDALRGKVPPHLLPPMPLGIRRLPLPQPRNSKPVTPPCRTKTAWADLYTRLREQGWDSRQLSSLSYLRVRAIAAGHAPKELTQSFIDTLQRDVADAVDRTRFRVAVREFRTLSREPAFTDLPDLTPPGYHNSTHGGPSRQVRGELEDLLDFMNAAVSTRRAFRVAVGVLTDAMGRPDLPLKDILKVDMTAYDLGPHEPRRKTHTNNIRNLRKLIELPWSPAWRELQQVVTATGMTALVNPVPKVLSWKPGADPAGLSLKWAQRLDREFRSTLTNPPHGRADIAKTLARHLKAFDALHDVPQIATSGLLPPKIGPIR